MTRRARGGWDSAVHAGRRAEDIAEKWLSRLGYRIVARNVRNAAGEIDLVAEEGETLCFIEVKSRRSAGYGRALEAVDWRKRRRIVRTAALYLAMKNESSRPVRFDVVGMDGSAEGWRCELVRGAFQADES